jgi:hypothetical protein
VIGHHQNLNHRTFDQPTYRAIHLLIHLLIVGLTVTDGVVVVERERKKKLEILIKRLVKFQCFNQSTFRGNTVLSYKKKKKIRSFCWLILFSKFMIIFFLLC